MSTSPWLDAADAIGRRIVADARWSGDACTWSVVTSDPSDRARKARMRVIAGPDVYQGTAGIALFLTQLYKITGDAVLRRTAEGALRHASNEGSVFRPNSFGFHTSNVGTAYALTRLATVTANEEWSMNARACLAPLYGREHLDWGLDIITGAAGAIPALLQMADLLDLREARDSALALGEHLLRAARVGPVGWSWPGQNNMFPRVRDLAGFAHGAAGYGQAFLELYVAMGDTRFRHGAEQAFAYEDQFFDAERENWPDFRHATLAEIFNDPVQRDELRHHLRAGGTAPPYRTVFMWAWCHGAPGVGLSRLRAYEVLGDPRYAAQVAAAVRSTIGQMQNNRPNYSLCHGVFGNCELPIMAAMATCDPALRTIVEEHAAKAIKQFEHGELPWPCGTLGNETDPSLMLGEAGIGYFLLRLHSPDVPSVLLMTAPSVDGGPAIKGESIRLDRAAEAQALETLRDIDAARFFDRTIQAFDRLQPGRACVVDEARRPAQPRIGAVYRVICQRLAEETDVMKARLLDDVSRPDRVRYEHALALTDNTGEKIAELVRTPVQDVKWGTARLTLASHVILIDVERDWDAWIADPSAITLPQPADSPIGHLVYRSHGTICERRLDDFPYLVLSTAQNGVTSGEITELVLALAPDADRSAQAVRAAVIAQLRFAYEMGIIEVHQRSSSS